MNNEIKIQPSKGNNKVEISNNFAQYFEQLAKKHADDAKESELLAKDWANKLGSTVDDTEYSSKHYALKSKEEHDGAVTDIATAKTELEQSIATGLEDYNTNAQAKSDSLQTQFDSLISDIKKQETTSVNAVKTTQTTAESSITELKTSAELTITNGMADITSNKEQSMSAINENRETSLADIESAKSGAVSSINTTKDNAVSTVKQTGTDEYNKILSTGIDSKLGENLITNCLKEIPQRIKLALEDGKMRLYKGSVLTYGDGTNLTIEEDVFSQQYVDATFENLILVYEPHSTAKMFVYKQDYNVLCQDTQPTTTRTDSIWFDTANHKMKVTHDAGATWYEVPLPIGIASITPNVWKSLVQVFNGMGCVGNVIWLDKGVKGLAANGKEIITDKLTFTTITDTVTRNRNININRNGVWTNADMFTYYQSTPPDIDKSNYQLWFKEDEKIVYEHLINADKWTVLEDIYLQAGICGWDSSSKRITSFTPKFPFRVTDYNDIDGKWVRQSLRIINSETAFPLGSQQYRDYDISNYLPNDGHIYELAVEILAFSGSATGAISHWWVSDILGVYQACSCGGRAYSNSRDQQFANGIIPMASRTLRLYCSSTVAAPTIAILRLCGYRKVR